MQQVVFLHTMRNEHFGISLVEAMAAGSDFHATFAPPLLFAKLPLMLVSTFCSCNTPPTFQFTTNFLSHFNESGAIVVAHNSGGPRDDICLEPVTVPQFIINCATNAISSYSLFVQECRRQVLRGLF